MQQLVQLPGPWSDPADLIQAFGDEPWALCLSSGPRWTYIAQAPSACVTLATACGEEALRQLQALRGPLDSTLSPGPAPFSGGVVGLASYDFGERLQGLDRGGTSAWPDLVAARFDALLAFDRQDQKVMAIGRGEVTAQAHERAEFARSWLDGRSSPAAAREGALLLPDDPIAYERAVADVIDRIGAGEIFQANIARTWQGALSGRPVDLFRRLAHASPAPFAAYLRLTGLALVSNSPERFIEVRDRQALTEPIKGTRPRGRDDEEDEALARQLEASAKDRAENLMIVDLMRNDLARSCRPGSVSVPALFDLRSYANVHHLVSTVRGELQEGLDAVDLLLSAFPPGSVTGAPKIQAMRVIAGHEGPRGPYCGSLFWLGYDGAMDSNVLIRSIACTETAGGWLAEARAGAGIVADSDPHAERLETEAKISAIAKAFSGAAQ